ncbi:MAG: hypothetical protein ABH883_04165, partial [Candidatus Omnitrophota bacterium]
MLISNKYKAFLKSVSLIVSFFFLSQQIVWAQGDMAITFKRIPMQEDSITPEMPGEIQISNDLALIDKVQVSGDAEETVINIQDCHSSLTAQYSIMEILQNLLQNYDVNVIGVEGGAGYIDTSVLSSLPDEGIKEKTAAYLMKNGRLSAGEFFSVMNKNEVALYGVEDSELYQENLKYFRSIYANNQENLRFLKKLIGQLNEAEDKIYPSGLKKMVYKSRLHHKGKITLDVYWGFLKEICADNSISVSGFSNIKNFEYSSELEGRIDFIAAASERKALIDKLMARADKEELADLIRKSLLFKQGKMSETAFYTKLLSFSMIKGIDVKECPNLVKYTEYVDYCGRLDVIRLQREIETIESMALEKLFSSDDEKLLYGLVNFTETLEGLFKIKLSPVETAYLSGKIHSVNVSDYARFTRKAEKGGGFTETVTAKMPALLAEAEESLKFYEVADKRNNVMLQNTINAMRTEGKRIAALISGGHHSQGLVELMRKQKLSYIVLMPRVKDNESRPYVAVLTKKTGPYKELTEMGEYDLAIETYLNTGDPRELDEMLAFSIGQIGSSEKDVSRKIREWGESYEAHYSELMKKIQELPAAKRGKFLEYQPITPEAWKKYLSNIKTESGPDACEVTIGGKLYRVAGDEMSLISQGKEEKIDVSRLANTLDRLESIFKLFIEGGLSKSDLKDRIPVMLPLVPAMRGVSAVASSADVSGKVSNWISRISMLIIILMSLLFGTVSCSSGKDAEKSAYSVSSGMVYDTRSAVKVEPRHLTIDSIQKKKIAILDIRWRIPELQNENGVNFENKVARVVFKEDINIPVRISLVDIMYQQVDSMPFLPKDRAATFDYAADKRTQNPDFNLQRTWQLYITSAVRDNNDFEKIVSAIDHIQIIDKKSGSAAAQVKPVEEPGRVESVVKPVPADTDKKIKPAAPEKAEEKTTVPQKKVEETPKPVIPVKVADKPVEDTTVKIGIKEKKNDVKFTPGESKVPADESEDVKIGIGYISPYWGHIIGKDPRWDHDGLSANRGAYSEMKQLLLSAARTGNNLTRVQKFFDLGCDCFTSGDDYSIRRAQNDVNAFFRILREVRKLYPDFKVIFSMISFEDVNSYPSWFENDKKIAELVNRMMVITGVANLNEPGVIWEPCNEIELAQNVDFDKRRAYTLNVLSSIKKINPGLKTTVAVKEAFELSLWEVPEILEKTDLFQVHIYVYGTDLPSLKNEIEGVAHNIAAFKKTTGKEVFIGEFGFKNHSNDLRRGSNEEIAQAAEILQRIAGVKDILVWSDATLKVTPSEVRSYQSAVRRHLGTIRAAKIYGSTDIDIKKGVESRGGLRYDLRSAVLEGIQTDASGADLNGRDVIVQFNGKIEKSISIFILKFDDGENKWRRLVQKPYILQPQYDQSSDKSRVYLRVNSDTRIPGFAIRASDSTTISSLDRIFIQKISSPAESDKTHKYTRDNAENLVKGSLGLWLASLSASVYFLMAIPIETYFQLNGWYTAGIFTVFATMLISFFTALKAALLGNILTAKGGFRNGETVAESYIDYWSMREELLDRKTDLAAKTKVLEALSAEYLKTGYMEKSDIEGLARVCEYCSKHRLLTFAADSIFAHENIFRRSHTLGVLSQIVLVGDAIRFIRWMAIK